MHTTERPGPRCALAVLFCAWLAVGLPVAAEPRVYGVELEVSEERERLLVFADAPLPPRWIQVDERTGMLALSGASLDPSAPTLIVPSAQGTVRRVTLFERAVEVGAAPEVRVVVEHRPSAPPQLEQRESVMALDFEPLRRPAAGRTEASIPIQYRRAPVERVVSDLARATGERLVMDDAVRGGSLTIEGPDRIRPDEARALLDSILLLRGLAAVPSPGGARVIVALPDARGRFIGEGPLPESGESVTALLRLREVAADDLVSVLGPYLGENTLAQAFPPSNSLILSGPASRLARLRRMIEALDATEATRTVTWPVYYADATELSLRLQEILGEEAVPVAASDARQNSLLLRVRTESLERARQVVDRLDRPASGHGTLRVVKLRHADPEAMLEILTTLQSGGRVSGAGGEPLRAAGLAGRDFRVALDAHTRALVVQAAPEVFSALIDVVRELDREPASIRVNVTVASVTLDNSLELGVDYLLPLTDPKEPSDLIAAVIGDPDRDGLGNRGESFTAAFTREPLVVPILDPISGETIDVVLPREGVSVIGSNVEARTEVLISPELVVVSGQEHSFFAGENIPIPISQAAPEGGETSGDITEIRQDIQRQDVGTQLRVLPTLGEEGDVVLELGVELSALGTSAAGDVSRVGPSIDEIAVESVIRLRPGEVAVIATAARPIQTSAESGVPWLRRVPILGFLFRATRDVERTRQLMITARAELLGPERRLLAERLRGLEEEQGPEGPG